MPILVPLLVLVIDVSTQRDIRSLSLPGVPPQGVAV